MEFAIIGILALIAGYFFIKKFTSIDRYFFSGGDPDYEPSGDRYLMLSIIIGALGSAAYFGNKLFYWDLNPKAIIYMAASCVATITFMAMIYAIAFYERPAMCFGKCVFMLFTCLIGAAMGVAGSVILFVIVVLWLILAVLGSAISGNPDKVKVKSNDMIGSIFGGEKTLTHESGDIYRDSSGHHYEKNGSDFTQID